MLEQLGRNWWVLTLRGVVAILFACLAFGYPSMTLTALVWLWGAYALVDGVCAVVASVRAAGWRRRGGMLLLEGVSGIAAGIIAFAWPRAAALALVYLIAAWAIVTGSLGVAAAARVRRTDGGGWPLGLVGALSTALGALMAAQPNAGLLAWVRTMGAYAWLSGLLQLTLAFLLTRAGGRHAVRTAH